MNDQTPSTLEATASNDPTTMLPDSEAQEATTIPPDPETPEATSASLPDPEDSFFFAGGPTPELDLPQDELPSNLPPFLRENERNRDEADRNAAFASLDETILRPFAMPIDFEPKGSDTSRHPPAPGAPLTGQMPQPSQPFSWKKVGIAAVIAGIALAVGIRASGSRKSNVGLFGVPPVQEQVAMLTDEEPDEELASSEDSYDSEPSETAAPMWQEDEYVEEEVEEEPLPKEEEDVQSHTFTWDLHDWPLDDESQDTPDDSYDSGESDETYRWQWNTTEDENARPNDDHTISWDFDGGNITYYYDDGLVTFDWDTIDEIEQYLDLYDVWGYGSPGGEQGYGSGYGYDAERTESHSDRDHDSSYYYYGW